MCADTDVCTHIHACIHMCTHAHIRAYISSLCPVKDTRRSDTLVFMSTCNTQLLVLKYYALLKVTRGPGEKWLVPGLGQKV